MNTQRFSGQRLTRQRKLVLDVVSDSQEHLDAETIYQLARERDENISLATVYRSLAYLKATGLIQEHNLGEDHGHFEFDPRRAALPLHLQKLWAGDRVRSAADGGNLSPADRARARACDGCAFTCERYLPRLLRLNIMDIHHCITARKLCQP